MTITPIDIFDVAKSITHPISLAAFAIASIMTYLINKNNNARKIIESAKAGKNSNLIIKTAEKLHLDITEVPEEERADLIKIVLTNRIKTQKTIAFVIVVLGLIIAFLVNKSISERVISDSANQNIDSTKVKEASPTQENKEKPKLNSDSTKFKEDSPKQEIKDNHGVVQQINGDHNTTTGTTK